MRILGIDPGSRKTGYGILEYRHSSIRYIDSGILKFHHIKEFNERLYVIFHEIEKVIAKFSPDEVAIESLIFAKSPLALIKLAQARGAMMAAILKTHSQKVFEYSPNIVKATTTGHGHAEKTSIQRFLFVRLGLDKFKSHDESDALAVAYCHYLNKEKNKNDLSGMNMSNSKRKLKGSFASLIKD